LTASDNSDSPHRGREERSRRFSWVNAGVIVSVLTLIATVIGIVVSHRDNVTNPPGGAVGPPPSTALTAPISSTPIGAPPAAIGQGADCLGIDQTAKNCKEPGTGVRLHQINCTSTGVLQSWGLNPDLDFLSLSTKRSGGDCVAYPGETATNAGISGADIVRAQHGMVPPSLRVCARASGTPALACNAPHELEYVGDWVSDNGLVDLQDRCTDLGTQYTENTLAIGSGLVAAHMSSQSQYRCLLKVQSGSLIGSVRGIGGGALPR